MTSCQGGESWCTGFRCKPDLPNEVVVEHILSRLPVKSLLRFRCVSKSWNHLIDHDKHFHKMHLATSSKKPRIIGIGDPCMSFSTDGNQQAIEKEEAEFLKEGRVQSSCDSLICIEHSTAGKPLCIVNLALRRSRDLPLDSHTAISPNICQVIRVPSTWRYKVLLVYQFAGASVSEICMLDRICCWRRIHFPAEIAESWTSYKDNSVLVDGMLHWINGRGTECRELSITSFHIKHEKFQVIVGPTTCQREYLCNAVHVERLVEFGGTLHLVHFNTSCFEMSVWMMLKNKEWEKLYCVGLEACPKEMKPTRISTWYAFYPVAEVDGEILIWAREFFTDKHQFVSYSHELRRFQNFNKQPQLPQHKIRDVFSYVDTLVWPST